MKIGAVIAIIASIASAVHVETQVETETETEAEFYLPSWVTRAGRGNDPYKNRLAPESPSLQPKPAQTTTEPDQDDSVPVGERFEYERRTRTEREPRVRARRAYRPIVEPEDDDDVVE